MRVFRIAIGYLAAAYCAVLIFLALLMIRDPDPSHAIGLLPYFAAFGTLFAIPLTILQSALLVILSERLRIRSLSFYLIAGLITGATVSFVLSPSGPLPASRNDWLLSLFLGLDGAVCAFVYWAIAGRKAGLPAQPRGHWMRCLFAGILLSAALTGFETFKLHGGFFSGLYAGSLSYCFLIHAALGTYFACALFERRHAAAAP